MIQRLKKLRTLLALGPSNLLRVGAYRIALKLGVHPSQKVRAQLPEGPFFAPPVKARTEKFRARSDWTAGQVLYFGRPSALALKPNGAPDWLAAGPQGGRVPADQPWWEIPDFNSDTGDIKTIWEASRFDWVLEFVQYSALGQEDILEQLNHWLADWCTQNPAYFGPNWKCGQEASIRVLHLVAAAVMLEQSKTPCASLKELIRSHLKRISPSMGYAIGQANNHGTSEAAALFVGGLFLGDAEGKKWARKGRYWLENRARILIEPDGTFSQYSVTYHRIMLDSYSFAEIWRRHMKQPAFSDKLNTRLAAATRWLVQMIEPTNGDVPNIGANDGAHILSLTSCGYRDFRPTAQLASALFLDARAYPSGPWDQALQWFGVPDAQQALLPPVSASLDAGGFHILRKGRATAYLRYPRFRFRPSQADALHLDLWVNGENILRDAGTFSYNSSPEETAYFNGTGAHNTVQFDQRDQMPRLGRFLFGDWLKARNLKLVEGNKNAIVATAGYRDAWGSCHDRKLRLQDNVLTVEDRVAGFEDIATLRWRLTPERDWTLIDNIVSDGELSIQISSDVPIEHIALQSEFESRYYLQKTPLQVLEVSFSRAGVLKTEIVF